MSSFDRRLAQALRKANAVDEEQLTLCLAKAAQEKSALSEILVKAGVFDEKELIDLVAREIGMAPIDLDRVSLNPELKGSVPQELAEQHLVIPVAKLGHTLTLAVVDPFDVVKIDTLRIQLKSEIRPVVASERAVKAAIRRFYSSDARELEALVDNANADGLETKIEADGERDDVNLSDLNSENSPVVKLTNLILLNAIRDGASDIHIEPFEKTLKVRYRQDGVLKQVLTPPRNLAASIASRIKIMCGLDIAEKRKPQDGKAQVKLEGRAIDLRVSTLPVVHGEKIVIRILDNSNLAKGLESLGFEEKALSDIKTAINAPYGMMLITGPTGSGKSTTLYSCVKELYSEEINFVTVEDPVEYQLEGINQVPVNPKRGVTFAGALRSILRQDPDIILIGEIRDAETVEIAVKAALTGHLVLSTLHTNDAPSAITRMIDMGLDPFLVASSVVLVSAQRLMRGLCKACKEPITVPAERLLALGFKPEEIEGAQLYRPVGCVRCHQGYKGRFAILETLLVSDPIRMLILNGKSAIDIKKQAIDEGMVTLRRCAILRALAGKTSLEEVVAVTMSDDQSGGAHDDPTEIPASSTAPSSTEGDAT